MVTVDTHRAEWGRCWTSAAMWPAIPLALAAAPTLGSVRVAAVPRMQAPADCDLAKAVFAISWRADLRVGFENLRPCAPSSRQRSRPAPDTRMTVAQARAELHDLVGDAPDFCARDILDVFVIRPCAAWNDRGDVLNLPAGAVNVANVDVDTALRSLLLRVSPAIYQPYTVTRQPVGSVSLTFDGGTLMRALNTVIGSGPLQEWELGYTGTAMLAVQSHDLVGPWAIAPLRVP